MCVWFGSELLVVPPDDFVFTASRLPHNVSGILYMGPVSKPVSFFYDGLRCVGTPTYRFPLINTGPAGSVAFGPGLINTAANNFPVAGHIDPGEAWYFQVWYRDGAGPCAGGSNLTNVVRVEFQP